MGRYPEPTRLKMLKGSADNKAISGEPVPSDGPVECPASEQTPNIYV